jgi:hypothetical protein
MLSFIELSLQAFGMVHEHKHGDGAEFWHPEGQIMHDKRGRLYITP